MRAKKQRSCHFWSAPCGVGCVLFCDCYAVDVYRIAVCDDVAHISRKRGDVAVSRECPLAAAVQANVYRARRAVSVDRAGKD
ncbi:MAG TPA: hypothetical protein DCY10_05105 [Clostridiales bacterium]|nr:hypothetical protein [Clostridiales bacterium]